MRSVMRRLIFQATVALTAAAPTFAADLAVKAPTAPVPFSWTGCYVGGQIGADFSGYKTTNVFGNSISFSSTGFVGGGQIGCDYQFAPRWIVGVEGQAAWTSLKNTHAAAVRNLATGVMVPSQFTLRNDFLASATARRATASPTVGSFMPRAVPPGPIKRSTMRSRPCKGLPWIPARP